MDDGGRPKTRRPGRTRLRRWLPVLFLLTSLTVAGVSALEAYRAQRLHRATATAVLDDYAEFAAWSYEQRVNERITSALQRTFTITHQNRTFSAGEATEDCLSMLLEDLAATEKCACDTGLAGRYSFFVRIDDTARAATWGGARPEATDRELLIRAVQTDARDVYAESWPFRVLYLSGGKGPVLAYVRLTARNPRDGVRPATTDTLIYGIEVARDKLVALFGQALRDEALLPPALTRGRPNDDVIQVEMLAPGSHVLFASRPTPTRASTAEGGLRPYLGGGTILTSVMPSAAEQLVIGGLPADRTRTLIVIVLLAGALAIAALVNLRRENRLALLREQFVASVSHELRTPLAQVRLFTDTLRLGRTRTDEQRDWALENIDRETLRLTHLVENILQFSRAERGVRASGHQPSDLGREARDALAAFQAMVPPSKARFVSDLPDGLLADVHRDSFRQVVLNLLDNAVRYGRPGQTVRIAASRVAGGHVRIAIEDEGPGVPSAERERIFDPFRRGSGAIAAAVAGSGIGLAVVREILHAHQGRVWVEQAPAGGARFVVELPANPAAHDGRATTDVTASARPLEPASAEVA